MRTTLHYPKARIIQKLPLDALRNSESHYATLAKARIGRASRAFVSPALKSRPGSRSVNGFVRERPRATSFCSMNVVTIVSHSGQ